MGIDAKGLTACAEFGIFKCHRFLFGTHGEIYQLVLKVGIQLLHKECAFLIVAHGEVCSVTDAPFVGAVGLCVANEACT